MLTIRRAVCDDIPNIMKFMDEHWKPGNILTKDRDFFEWQFVEDGKVNMFIGIDDEEGKIYGMMGAIIYNHKANPDISGCTWKTIKSERPMLGMELLDSMCEQLHCRYACSAGLSEKAVKINELLGRIPISMDHYYRLADKEIYQIASITKKIIPEAKNTGYSIAKIFSVEEMKKVIREEKLDNAILSKDYIYIDRRYFKHPVYQYDVWKIFDNKEESHSVLVTREEKKGRDKICKIIDFYGNIEDFTEITAALDELMKQREYEFIDVYSYGVPTDIYEKAGFVCCNEDDENIIPNYFHPFVRKNISLRMMDPLLPGLRLFRGDGDQDRPC